MPAPAVVAPRPHRPQHERPTLAALSTTASARRDENTCAANTPWFSEAQRVAFFLFFVASSFSSSSRRCCCWLLLPVGATDAGGHASGVLSASTPPGGRRSEGAFAVRVGPR